MENKVVARIFQVLFYTLCVCYIGFYMPYGLEGTDTGYIFGSSWNIYNGQLPHRDFIYTRPAIPAYFHTVFLFISETYGYLLDRSFFYIQIFFYSFLGAKLLTEHFSIHSKSTLYFLATLGAVVSIHNYPPMGWNTIDGIFFWMIGLYLFLKEKQHITSLLIGVLFMILGTFSKQSFYFMPIFLGIYLLLQKDWRRLKYYIVFGLIWLAAYVGFKAITASLNPLLEQTFSRTESGALIAAGVKAYYLALKFNVLYVLIGFVVLVVAYRWLPKKYGYLLMHLIIAGIFIYMYSLPDSIHVVKSALLQILFVFSVGYSLWMLRKDNKFLLLLLLLSLSWSASISGGFKTPIHFSLPILFGIFHFFFPKKISVNEVSVMVYGTILTTFAITFYIGYQSIYRDSDRAELIYEMGSVFPQLSTIKSDQQTFEKYRELKALAQKHPNFTVLPTVTLAHYLTKTVNPMGTDWPHDVEINFEGERLLKRLQQQNTIVFIEKTEFSDEDLNDYEIVNLVVSSWELLSETEHFKVYSPQQ